MRNMQKKTGAMTTILLLCSVFLLLPGTCIAAVAPNIAWECETNSECDDGIFCNGAETCS